MDPKVLLLDEPFSALDALTRATLQEELGRIWMDTRKTVVMITNDIDEAILLADSIYTLMPGPGATLGAAVRVDTPHPRSRAQLGGAPGYQRVRRETVSLLVTAGTHHGGQGTPAQSDTALNRIGKRQ
jgi:nitrate/nitrite transport system ATP-binding protein